MKMNLLILAAFLLLNIKTSYAASSGFYTSVLGSAAYISSEENSKSASTGAGVGIVGGLRVNHLAF